MAKEMLQTMECFNSNETLQTQCHVSTHKEKLEKATFCVFFCFPCFFEAFCFLKPSHLVELADLQGIGGFSSSIFLVLFAVSTSPPGGNQVDGLPPAASLSLIHWVWKQSKRDQGLQWLHLWQCQMTKFHEKSTFPGSWRPQNKRNRFARAKLSAARGRP